MKALNFQSLAILAICCSLIASCSTEFEPHLPSDPTPLVYGLINPDDSLYQIRLTRSYIGPGNAYNYAKIPDSIYYDNAQVFFETQRPNGSTIERIELLPVEINAREEGIFASSPNIVYQTDFQSIDLRSQVTGNNDIDPEVYLFVEVQIPGNDNLVESVSQLKGKPRIINPRGNFQKVYFYGELPFYMEWTHTNPDTYFEIKVVMRYREILEEGEREAEVDWVLKGIEANEMTFPGGSRTIYTYYFRADNFYSQVRAAIPVDPAVKGRAMRNLDFIILTSDGSVKEYHQISSIADDYNGASYSNIINGLGLFATYNEIGVYDQKLGQRELDSLAKSRYTRHLNFNPWL